MNPFVLRRGVIAAILVLVGVSCTGAKSEPDIAGTPTPDKAAQSADVGALRVRPLSLPTLAGQTCPVTTESSAPSRDLAAMWGTGPVRAVGGAEIKIAPPRSFQSVLWGGNKLLWAMSVEIGGPALIRGRQLDGDAEARFDDGPVPSPEKVLNPANKVPLDGGWLGFPGFVRLTGPGCYAFQVDTTKGTTILVLKAVNEL